MIGEPFIILPTIDSTNNYAKGLIRDGLAKLGTVVFAEEQTQGRGQKNNQWHSEQGANIMMSVLLDTTWLSINEQFQLSCATAVACSDFFSKYAGDETCIKWPNDLYWRDRKAGGILIENLIKGNIGEKAIVGIGININQINFNQMKNKPVSLKQITGQSFDVKLLARELCTFLDKRYNELKEGNFENHLDLYNQRLFKRGEAVTLKKGNEMFAATIESVNKNGELMTDNQLQSIFTHGEVEWIL
jgi:BirA family transcriptional regulator, biotin operon repressor / biotin---[acetyl-CoA-carboxylase] ligase